MKLSTDIDDIYDMIFHKFYLIKLQLLKCEIKIQIYRKIKAYIFLRSRIYLSMTFHLCKSVYS